MSTRRKANISNPKTATKPKITNSSQNQSPENDNTAQDDSTTQFQLELYWCIQQLERNIISEKLNPRQVQDCTKALNALKSKSAAMIKKRQVMRSTFGDYRTKMAEEEKKCSKEKFNTHIACGEPNKNSKYVKKCSAIKLNCESNSNSCNTEMERENVKTNKYLPSDNSFRFNFTIDCNI